MKLVNCGETGKEQCNSPLNGEWWNLSIPLPLLICLVSLFIGPLSPPFFFHRTDIFFRSEARKKDPFCFFSPFEILFFPQPCYYCSIEWYFTSESSFFSQIWFLDEYEKGLGRTDRRTDIVEWKDLLCSDITSLKQVLFSVVEKLRGSTFWWVNIRGRVGWVCSPPFWALDVCSVTYIAQIHCNDRPVARHVPREKGMQRRSMFQVGKQRGWWIPRI